MGTRPAQARPVTYEEFDRILKEFLPPDSGRSLEADLRLYTGLRPFTQSTNYMSLRGYLWWRSMLGLVNPLPALKSLKHGETGKQPDETASSNN